MKTLKKKEGSTSEPSATNAPSTPFTIIIDSREPTFQRYDFSAYGAPLTRVEKLETGDYSVAGLEALVAVERKTLDDLAKSITLDRFWAELDRARVAHLRFCVVVEGTMADVESQLYASAVKPSAIFGACLAIGASYGFPVVWAGSRQKSAEYTAAYLKRCFDRAEVLKAEAEQRAEFLSFNVKQEALKPCIEHAVAGCTCGNKKNKGSK